MDVCFRKRASNPKRLQREIHKQSQQSAGIGTKSQQALQMQREQGKQDRKAMCRDRRDAENLRRFALKLQKRKEKHRRYLPLCFFDETGCQCMCTFRWG